MFSWFLSSEGTDWNRCYQQIAATNDHGMNQTVPLALRCWTTCKLVSILTHGQTAEHSSDTKNATDNLANTDKWQ